MAVTAESASGRHAALQPKIPLPGERAGACQREGRLLALQNVPPPTVSDDLFGEWEDGGWKHQRSGDFTHHSEIPQIASFLI